MSAAFGAAGVTGAPGGGVPGGGVPGGVCASASESAGVSAVGGSRLPPDISAVGAFDAGGDGVSSDWLSGGAKTVTGSGTEPSSPASALVSVPAHGVAPTGEPPPAAGQAAPLPGATGAPGTAAPTSPAPDPPAVPDPPVVPAGPPEVSPRRSGIPNRSAASCNHSGGLSRNDV